MIGCGLWVVGRGSYRILFGCIINVLFDYWYLSIIAVDCRAFL